MFDWFTGMTPLERRTFWASFGGWALDAMDVQIYALVVPALIAGWHLTSAEVGQLGAAALFTSALGGWLAGLLSDRVGRVRMLQISVLWFAFFTFLSAFAQDFGQLFVLRLLQGFGFGGEWAAGAVLMGEVVEARHRGKAVGCVQAGWAVGWAVAVLVSGVVFTILPPHLAWRALFMTGILPALLVFFVRRFVPEPQIFSETRKLARERGEAGFLTIFGPEVRRATVLSALLATGAQGGYHAITTFLPNYLKSERHLSVLSTHAYLAVIVAGSFLGYVVSAYLADAIGRRRNFVLFAVASVVTVLVYMFLAIGDAAMLILGFPLGFFASGIFSGMGPFLTEIYPSRMRGSGQGFCYNFGRAAGALFPWLVGLLERRLGLGPAIGVFAVAAYGVMALAALALPETKGKQLQAYR
ncbi:MAG: MFS transporter [Minicystis sp.]